MMELKFEEALREAGELGGWPQYAIKYLGMCDTGNDRLDNYLANLYTANEDTYRQANKLCLRFNLDCFGV